MLDDAFVCNNYVIFKAETENRYSWKLNFHKCPEPAVPVAFNHRETLVISSVTCSTGDVSARSLLEIACANRVDH